VAWEPDYVTSAELKAYLRIADTDDDAMVAIYATTASRAVDSFCHRQFGKVAAVEEREYSTEYDRHLGCYVAFIDDLMDVDDLVVLDENANEITEYSLQPVNALKKGKPYERIAVNECGPLTISGLWGWTSVPVPVKNAALLQGARLAARRDSPFGVAGSPTEGSELRLLAQLDPDLRTSLGSKYRRERWAA
jgi:hypothetical protein